MRIELPDAVATQRLGAALAEIVGPGCIALSGDLGAGKTELARALIQGLGYIGRVKSPTYTLVEPYPTPRLFVTHWDLYRIGSSDELAALGMREQPANALMLVEWPERAQDQIASDLDIRIEHHGNGRIADLQGRTPAGAAWLQRLADDDATAALKRA